jgi:hypothetical protein
MFRDDFGELMIVISKAKKGTRYKEYMLSKIKNNGNIDERLVRESVILPFYQVT